MRRITATAFRSFLAVTLALGLFPCAAFADEDASSATIDFENLVDLEEMTFRVGDEFYFSLDSVEGAGSSSSSNAGLEVYTYDQALAVAVDALENRAEEFTVSFAAEKADYPSKGLAFINDVYTEDGNPRHGDYLRYHAAASISITRLLDTSTGQYYIKMKYSNTDYRTTSSQEEELASDVASILASLDISGKSEYEKAAAIYGYICSNVAYDYDHTGDADYVPQFTAYAALEDESATCLGYASLFYYMATEAGLSTRIVTGTSEGGARAWNIVRLDGLYYNVDPTWDAIRAQKGFSYEYFLKSDADFSNHTRDSSESDPAIAYASEDFYAAYPMAAESYSVPYIDIADAKVNMTSSYVYNGKVRTPVPTVSISGVALVAGKDYVVSYGSGRNLPGAYSVVIRGIGEYSGSVTKTFTITDCPLSRASVALSASTYTYNGYAKKPSVTVKVNGVKQLSNSSRYTLTYWNKAGTKRVTPKAIGAYGVKIQSKSSANTSGYVWRSFKIIPSAPGGLKLTRLNNGFRAKWSRKSSAAASGYQLAYRQVGTKTWKYKTVSGYKASSKSITRLKNKKYYQVKARTYKTVGGVKYYSSWTGAKKVKTY